MSADEARQLADAALIEGPAARLAARRQRGQYLGREDFDGTLAYKLKVTQKDGDEFVYWLDPDTYLEIKVDETRRIRGAQQTTETELGDYEKVAGVYFPMSVESWQQGQPNQRQRTIIASGTANPPVSGTYFAEPGGPAHARQGCRQPPDASNKPQGKAEHRSPAAKPTASQRRQPPKGRVTMLRKMLLASAARRSSQPGQRRKRFDSAAISGLGVRNIGSATMSGRIAAVAGRQEKDGKVTLLIGSASGGVWKSEDGGTTFKPVFDKQPVKSIGAVALDPDEPGRHVGRHRRKLDPQFGLASATASTSRPTAARPGPTSGLPERRADHAASSSIRRTATSSTSARRAPCGRTRPTAASTRRPTAARPGR